MECQKTNGSHSIEKENFMMNKKMILTLILSLGFLFHLTPAQASGTITTQGEINVYTNGIRLPVQKDLVIEKGRTLIPLRGVFEALGAEVNWNGKNQTIEVKRNQTKVWLKIGSKQAKVNGKTVHLATPAKFNKNGRTIVPLRFISEALGESVIWEEYTQAIYIGKVPYFKKPTGLPKGAKLESQYVFSVTYLYPSRLPNGGKVEKVTLSMPGFPHRQQLQMSILFTDHLGNFAIGERMENEHHISNYLGIGNRPVMETADYDALNKILDNFFKAYGK